MYRYNTNYLMLQEEKLIAIIHKQKTITDAANELNVSRPTIYAWLARYTRYGIDGLLKKKRKKSSMNPHNKTAPDTEHVVIHLAHTYPFDGVETLSDRLFHEHGISDCEWLFILSLGCMVTKYYSIAVARKVFSLIASLKIVACVCFNMYKKVKNYYNGHIL